MASLPLNHSYELVADDEEEQNIGLEDEILIKKKQPLLWRLEHFIKRFPRAIFISLLIVAFVIYSLATWSFWNLPRTLDCDNVDNGFQCQPEISHFWGQYSPYFSVASNISDEVPDSCEITFVQVLSRHGARDPTRSKSLQYSDLMKTLLADVKSFHGKYAFLQDYQYGLGADQLTSLGRKHMLNSGIKFYDRYKDLTRNNTPFIRASGQTRVVDSGQQFLKGYQEACSNDTLDATEAACRIWPYPYAEISEEPGSHNPLDHQLCDLFEESHGSGILRQGQGVFQNIFAKPITARLNRDLVGADLDDDDTISIMDVCPFETVADPQGKLSPFCSLFSTEEWKQYDYYQSLGKYYDFASYDGLGPTQGVGFTNELIARLTGKPVQDRTSVDHELDGNQTTFPLGDQWKIYADFSHDNDMVGIMAAMGIFNSTQPLRNDTVQDGYQTNGFSTSWLVPFAARIYFEKMACTTASSHDKEEYIRIIVNDRVQEMKSCGADELGRCKLSDFLDSLSFAKNGGRWDEC